VKIRTKLVLSFTTIGLAATVFSLLADIPVHSRVQQLGAFNSPALYQIQQIESGIKGAVQEGFAYVVSGAGIEKDEFLEWDENFDGQIAAFSETLDRMDLPAKQAQLETAMLARIIGEQEQLVRTARVMFEEFESDGQVNEATFVEFEDVIDSLLIEVERFVEVEKGELDEAHELAIEALEISEAALRAFGFALLVFAVLAGVVLSRLITRPLLELVDASAEVGSGNLDRKAKVMSQDEIGQLAQAFNTMTSNLREKTTSVERLNEEIAEREHAEEQLKVEHDHLSAMTDALPDLLLEVDKEGCIYDVRAPDSRLLGDPPDALIGRNVDGVFRGDAVQVIMEALGQAAQTGSHRGATFSTQMATGRRWFELSISVRGQRNDDSRFVMLARDVTDRRAAEQGKIALERQLQHAQKLESLGVLAGGIAHDFNNLLVGILGNADLALDETSPVSPIRRNLKEIENAAKRAADLANQMLAYSGKGRFVVEPIAIGELVQEMAYLLEVSIPKKIVLKYNLADGIPTFDGDATQVRQIIMNLITNASESIGSSSGVIAVSTGIMDCDRDYLDSAVSTPVGGQDGPLPEGVYIYFEVADTGSGMDHATIEKIFDPFFTTKFTGRGLGMSAALGIVRGHKGVIRIYSESGKGTTFKVLFPANPDSIAKLTTREDDVDADLDWRSAGTILIVDDEQTVRTVGKHMAERFGFDVLLAADGIEALELFRENREDIVCVLLDLTMPRMDGEEAFREMRRIDPDVAVILCSGYNKQDATQRFAGKGLVGFMQKPFQLSTLRETLQSVLTDSSDDD